MFGSSNRKSLYYFSSSQLPQIILLVLFSSFSPTCIFLDATLLLSQTFFGKETFTWDTRI